MIGGGALLAVVIVAFVVMLVAITNQRDSSDRVQRADDRIALANQLERRIVDIETGQRGFVITGQPRFLEPRSDALKVQLRIRGRLLGQERRDGTLERVQLLKLTFRHLDAYIGFSNRLVSAAEVDLGSARQIMLTGEGKRRVDAMRAELQAFMRAESDAARAVSASAAHSASIAVLFAVIGLILVPLLILVLIGLMSRTVAAPVRRAADAAERLRAGDLAIRVEETGLGEVHTLGSAFNEMATSLQHNRDELESQNAELEAQQGELERSVDELAEERDRIQRFYDFVSRLAQEYELGPLGEALLEELGRISGADASALYAIEPTGPDQAEELRLVACSGFDPEGLPPSIVPGSGLAGRALLEERPVEGDHGEGGLELDAFGRRVRIRHEVHVPIGRPGGMIGVVSLGKIGESGFSEEEKQRLAQRSGAAGVALANALSLEASERAAALNQAVLDSTQDAYVAVDADGIVLAWNPTAESLYGIAAADALGRPVAELVLPEDPEARAAHDERRGEILEAARGGESLERYQVWAKRSDGAPIHVEASAAAVHTSAGSVVTYFSRDITDQTRREAERAAAAAVSRALAEVDPHGDPIVAIIAALGESLGWPLGGFWEHDEAAGVVRCSRIWTEDGFEFPEFEDYARELTYTPGGPMPDLPVLKQAWDSQSVCWDVPGREELSERQQAAGDSGLRAGLAMPVHGGAEMRGVLTFGTRDAEAPDEARLAALRSITDLIGQVMERRDAELEAERMKNEFFALVSHELKTPLTSIVGYLEMLREDEEGAGEAGEQRQRYLGVIDRNARRLQRLVSDLLFVAQVEAGRMPLNREPVELESVATEAVEAAQPQADKQGVRLSVDSEAAAIAAGDGGRLGQLVDNLVSNAIKFTPEGGSVTVRLRNGGTSAILEVADTGMGISEADQRNLFDRFYRTDDATKLAIPGIGLGLSIGKAIAEARGGAIGVESSEGQGTTFRVELPLDGRAEAPDRGSNGKAPAEERLVRG